MQPNQFSLRALMGVVTLCVLLAVAYRHDAGRGVFVAMLLLLLLALLCREVYVVLDVCLRSSQRYAAVAFALLTLAAFTCFSGMWIFRLYLGPR